MSLNLLTNSVVLDVTQSVVKSIVDANKASFSMTVEGGAETPGCVFCRMLSSCGGENEAIHSSYCT